MDYATSALRGLSSRIAPVLRRRNPILAGVTLLLATLFVAFVVGIPLDSRSVGGEPVWLKPAKFAGSLALFAGTLAWLSPHLPVSEGALRRLSWGIAAGIVLELALIATQAARGVESHFNDASALDTAIYNAMGATIVAVLLLVVVLAVAAWIRPIDGHPAFAWGIRLGLAVFVIGSFEGGAMVAFGASAVGSGPAVPVLGWAVGGDFRVAHFVGLHALQALPLVGYLVTRRRRWSVPPLSIVGVAAAIHLAVLVVTFAHALGAVGG